FQATAKLPQIPGFHVESELGRGGMGVVYLARQLRLNRLVALKMIISGGHANEETKLRFLGEAEAIAKLHHPGIVQVHEFGTHDNNPYFALEYVSGGSLDKKLAGNPLPPREAAELVEKLARAVQSAHDAGIIHRDLKPANILLDDNSSSKLRTQDSALSAFSPKITDFGLVKNVGSDMTATGQILGTPSYMAPEQADGKKSVGPAADIYALGAILYECLTGRAPFKAVTPLDTLLQVLNDEPVSLRQLQAKTPMDLETICHKCLQKDAGKRYGSATELAEDLRRYLGNEPIKARRIGRVERSWRWCKRYPAVAALVFVSVLAALVASGLAGWAIYSRSLAENAKTLAEAKEKEAKTRQEETAAVLAFIENKIFRKARPKGKEGGMGIHVTLFDAISSVVPELSESFIKQPLIEARLRQTIGLSFSYLGKENLAEPQFVRAIELQKEHLGSDHSDTLYCMNYLASSYHVLGKFKEALALAEQTLKLQKEKLGTEHPDTIHSMLNLAAIYNGMGRFQEALRVNQETYQLLKKKYGPDDKDTLSSMHNLAVSYSLLGKHADALATIKENLNLRMSKYGPDHPDTLKSQLTLAGTYEDLERFTEALSLKESTLAQQKTILGFDHPDTLACMQNLAMSYVAVGRMNDALKLRQKTLQLLKNKYGSDHPETMASMASVASSLFTLNRFDEAKTLFEEALRLQTDVLGNDHRETVSTRFNLAIVFGRLNMHTKALELREEIYESDRKNNGPDHPDTLGSMNSLANAYAALNKHDKAQKMFVDLISTVEKLLAVDPAKPGMRVMLAGACCNLGKSLTDTNQFNDSLPWYEKGRKHLESELIREPNNARARLFLCNIHTNRALAFEGLARYQDADIDWKKAIDLSPDHDKQRVSDGYDEWRAKRKNK
ncbi:MAG TPA: tetratricopeptide repeat protein, partial [Gemmatales bacterium]|nr:tetratricopeptide repeat protein [Gemmatales bacterium]